MPEHLELVDRVAVLRAADRRARGPCQPHITTARARQDGDVLSAAGAGARVVDLSPRVRVVRYLDVVGGCVRSLPMDREAADLRVRTEIELQPLRIAERRRPARRQVAVDCRRGRRARRLGGRRRRFGAERDIGVRRLRRPLRRKCEGAGDDGEHEERTEAGTPAAGRGRR